MSKMTFVLSCVGSFVGGAAVGWLGKGWLDEHPFKKDQKKVEQKKPEKKRLNWQPPSERSDNMVVDPDGETETEEAEAESPTDDRPMIDVPIIISEDDFDRVPEQEPEMRQVFLDWWLGDDVICDSATSEIFTEGDTAIGSGILETYRHDILKLGNTEEKIEQAEALYVRNDLLGVVFMLNCHAGRYRVEVLGEDG